MCWDMTDLCVCVCVVYAGYRTLCFAEATLDPDEYEVRLHRIHTVCSHSTHYTSHSLVHRLGLSYTMKLA